MVAASRPADQRPAIAMMPKALRGVITLNVVKQSAPLIRSAVTLHGTSPVPKKLQKSVATVAMLPLVTAAILLEMARLAVKTSIAVRSFVQSIHSAVM